MVSYEEKTGQNSYSYAKAQWVGQDSSIQNTKQYLCYCMANKESPNGKPSWLNVLSHKG